MIQTLALIQTVIGVFLVGAILLQNRGTGLSSIFGGEGGMYRTRRGAERAIFVATIVLAALFLGLGIVGIIIA